MAEGVRKAEDNIRYQISSSHHGKNQVCKTLLKYVCCCALPVVDEFTESETCVGDEVLTLNNDYAAAEYSEFGGRQWLKLERLIAVAKSAAVFVLKVLPEDIQNQIQKFTECDLCASQQSNSLKHECLEGVRLLYEAYSQCSCKFCVRQH